jgi:phosphatidylethanolamine-binding protein (PEBP) family uncharacterized protein
MPPASNQSTPDHPRAAAPVGRATGRPTGRPKSRPKSRSKSRIAVGIIVCILLTLSTIACGSSGRELRDPAPGATTPPRKGSSTTAANVVSPDDSSVILRPTGFALSSSDWVADGTIPVGLGCGGADISPALSIDAVPEGTAELLLIASDTSDPSATRWIVAGIPIATTAIAAGTIPAGAIAVVNAAGTTAWVGPCPPKGISTTFQVRLYALRTPTGITDASQAASVTTALTTATQAAVLRGTYTRPN